MNSNSSFIETSSTKNIGGNVKTGFLKADQLIC